MELIEDIVTRWSDAAIPYLRLVAPDDREPIETEAIAATSLLSQGASESDITAMETRLSASFPCCLKRLLTTSNGFIIPVLGTGPTRFLRTDEIDYYHKRETDDFLIWERFAENRQEYEVLSESDIVEFEFPSFDCLRRAFALSGVRGGDVLLIYPIEQSSTSRWEYIKLSVHTRSYRCGSLATLLTELMRHSLDALRAQEAASGA